MVSGHFPAEVRWVQRESWRPWSSSFSSFVLVLVLMLILVMGRGRIEDEDEDEDEEEGESRLSALVQRCAEGSQVRREARGIEGVERPDILEKLIKLGLDLQGRAAILAEGIG